MASPRRERASLVRGGRVALAGVAVWVLLGPGTVRAETPAPPPARFARLTTADGLSEPRIWAVLQDRTGFLWIGTPDGLNRYDGHVVRVFHNDPSDPGSLGPGTARALLEDRRGRLWVGLIRGGISVFDPATERFLRYRHDPADSATLSQDDVVDLVEAPDGAVWAATSQGLNRLDPDTGRAIRYTHDASDPQSLGGDNVTSLARDPSSGGLWVALGDGGLDRIVTDASTGRARFEHWRQDRKDPRSLPSDKVNRLLVDGKGSEEGTSLWVTLLPPWWATWWFRLSALVGVVMALLAAHNARTRIVRARNERLERDLHERQQAYDAAARSERQLRLVADALPHLIAQLDENRRFVFSNMALDRAAGRPLEGMLLEEALPPSLLPIVRAPVARALAGEEQAFEADLEAPGTRFRFAITLLPRAEGHGLFGGFYAVAQDITARARLEDAARRQQAQLAHASRVLTLGELAAAIAHELNQPLTAILLNAQAALRLESSRGTPPDDVAGALGDIAADAVRGGEIIRKLRDLVRRGDSKRDTVDLNQAIRGIEPLLRAGAHEQDVVFDLDLAPDLPRTRGDSIQIQQVVLNLAGNAVEAMKAVSPSERRLRIRSAPLPGAVAVEVRDTGPPIAATELDQFFVAFRSTKAEGLGMGLAICRSIVEAHGGRIAAQPNPGGGLSVRFTLPVGNPSDSDRS